jgi:hypothetical protein
LIERAVQEGGKTSFTCKRDSAFFSARSKILGRGSFTGRRGTMHSLWRTLTFGVVLALGVVLGAGVVSLSAQGNDPRVGTWKLNVAKSKYSPGPAPQSLTVKVEPVAQGEKVTAEFVNADGTRSTVQYVEANFDGKDYPLTGSQFGADTVSLKRIDRWTTERTDKKGSTVIQTLRRVVSKDGKTMTVTTKGTDAKGQAMNNVALFERQ